MTNRPPLLESSVSHHPDDAPDADPIARLLAALSRWTLDPRLEDCGPVIDPNPRHCVIDRDAETWERTYTPTTPIYPDNPGAVCFSGNFFDYSFGFHVATDDPEVIARLTAAVEANQASAGYARAKAECA